MLLFAVQIAGLVVLGGGSLLAGLLPSCLRGLTARLSSGPGLSYLACYGGGVILATCFTHMMPEVAEITPVMTRSFSPNLRAQIRLQGAEIELSMLLNAKVWIPEREI